MIFSATRSKTKIFVLYEINIWAAKNCVIWWSNLQKSFWFGKSFDNLDNSYFVILFNLAKQRSEDEGPLFGNSKERDTLHCLQFFWNNLVNPRKT